MTSAGLQSITNAERDSNRAKPQYLPDPVYLGDGNGNFAVPGHQAEQLVWYYESGPNGVRVVGSAPLYAQGSIDYAATLPTTVAIEAFLGKPPHDDRVHVMTQTPRGITATGGISLKQQTANQAKFPSEQNLQGFRVGVSAVSGLNEVYVNPAIYTVPASGAKAEWAGGLSGGIAAAITALTSTGKHQIAWITFDDAVGAVHVETPVAAATPVGALPSRAEFTDTTIMAMATTYKNILPLYLYDGQTLIEADIYRRLDCRLQWFNVPPYSRTATATTYAILPTDNYIGVTNTGSAWTMTLPAANAVLAGKPFPIQDESGAAATHNITISKAGSDTVNGGSSVTISTNYGRLTLYSDGSSKWFAA